MIFNFCEICLIDKDIILINVMKKNKILKLTEADEEKEIQFELDYLFSLSIHDRFQLMFNRNRELLDILEKNGYRRSPEIIKRA